MIEYEIKPASRKMVEFACKNYHYSKTVPSSRLLAFAVFEGGQFIGVIVYSLGASNNLAKSLDMVQGDVIELTRIAFTKHENYVTQYIAKTLRMIKEISPRVKIVVSFADTAQNHEGKIYQASNWIYLGLRKMGDMQYFFKGRWTHQRTINNYTGEKRQRLLETLPKRKNLDKHKYIYCLDKKLRKHWQKQSKPYPKSESHEI